MPSRENLHEYQERAIQFIKDKKRCMLILSMGLGKTTSTLTAMSDLLDGMMVSRVLVIAPLRVASSVWKQECAKWEHLNHLRVSVCLGTERQRLAALNRSADVYTINRENIPWLVKHYGDKWPFDAVVIDESSSFKSASSGRFKALRKVMPKTNYAVCLTGTPAPNGLLDLWAQVYLVDFGASLGRTMHGYKQRFFESDYMGYKFAPRAGAADQIHKAIAPIALSMRAEDYLQLPQRIDLIEYIDLPAAALELYKDFERELLAELPTGEEIEAMNAAVLANKLLQLGNGAMYTDDKGSWREIHAAKIDALKELVEANDEPTLVAYGYKTDLVRLIESFPEAVVLDKDPETISRWNCGEIKMLLAHPASAGHGLNLQDGGALCVWFGLTWSLELYQQFNARLHRQGQQKPVRIVHLVARGCIDERVVNVLSDKDAQQSSLMLALKPKG
jgi:SNF2 family DNA or RNA helicase